MMLILSTELEGRKGVGEGRKGVGEGGKGDGGREGDCLSLFPCFLLLLLLFFCCCCCFSLH